MGSRSEDRLAQDYANQSSDDALIRQFESSITEQSPDVVDKTTGEPMTEFEKQARELLPEETAALDAVLAEGTGIDVKETPSKGVVSKSKVTQQEFQKKLPGIIRPLFAEEVLIDPSLGLAEGTTMSLGRLTTQATASVADAIQETGNAFIQLGDVVDNWMQKKGYTSAELIAPNTKLDFVQDVFPAPQTTSEKVTRAVSKHVVAVGLIAKAAKGTAAAKGVKASVGSAAFNFFAVDPKEERLSNIVQEAGPSFAQPIAAYLATEKDDSVILSRFKNGVESLALDAGLATALTVMVKGYKGARTVKRAVVAAKEDASLEKAAKEFEKAGTIGDLSEEAVSINPTEVIESVKLGRKPSGFKVNVERLSDEPDLRGFIKKIVTANSEQIEQFRRGSISDPELLQKASALAGSEADVTRLSNLPPGSSVTAEEKIVIDGLFVSASEQLQKFIKTFDPDNATAAQHMEFMNHIGLIDRLSKISYGTSAELGRGLRATQLVSKMSPINKAKFLQEQVKLMGGRGNIKKITAVLKDLAESSSDDFIDSMGKISQKSVGRKWFDAALEVRMNGLLSSGKTLMTGFISPMFITGPASIIERGLGRIWTVASGQPGVAKGETGQMLAGYMSESGRAIQSVWGAFEDWMVQSAKGLRDGDIGAFLDFGGPQAKEKLKTAGIGVPNRLHLGQIVEPSDRTPAISAKAFGLTEGSFLADATDAAGAVIRSPLYALSTSDQMVGQILYNMEKRALAVRELAGRGIDVTTKDGQALFQELISDMPSSVRVPWINEAAENIKKSAGQFSAINKFTSQLEGMASNIDQLIKSDIMGAPYLRLFMPFARVELNILTYGLERFPGLNFLSQRIRDDLRAGGSRAAMAKAKMSLGSMFIGSGITLSMSGIVTGTGPDNKDARKLLEMSGWRPNSLKIGDTYYQMDRIGDPFASMLAFGADMADIAEAAQKSKPQEYHRLVAASSSAIMEVMTPEFLTRNMADLLYSLNPRNEKTAGQQVITGLVKGQIPFSGLLRDVRKDGLPFGLSDGDRAIRETWDKKDNPLRGAQEMLNAIKADLPGFSESLPPRRNLFGDVVHYPNGFGPDEISPVATMQEAKGRRKVVVDELVRLGVAGRAYRPEAPEGLDYLVIKMPERAIQKSMGGQLVAIDMNPKQYDKFVRYSAGLGLEPRFNPTGRGLTLEEAMHEEITNGWPNLGTQKNIQNKRIYIGKLIAAYREGAKAQLATEDQDFREKFDDLMLRVIDIRSAFDETSAGQ
jgi:hypothetical protein